MLLNIQTTSRLFLLWLLAQMDQPLILILLVQPFKPSRTVQFSDGAWNSLRGFRHWSLPSNAAKFCEEVRMRHGLDQRQGLAAATAGCVLSAILCTLFTSILHPGIFYAFLAYIYACII